MSLSLKTVAGRIGLPRALRGVHGDGVRGRVSGGVPQDVTPQEVPDKVVLVGLGGVVSTGVLSEVLSVVPCRARGGVPGWVPS